MQGSILLEVPVSLFPSVRLLRNIFLRASRHVVYVAWTQVMVVYELVSYYFITIFLSWIQICPHILYLKDSEHLVPNKHSIYDERFGEWSDKFRVTSKPRWPTEDQSTSNHFLIICEVLANISAVCGITCINWSYKIITQSITDRFPINSLKSSNVLFHRFQIIGAALG